jgi:hypothetical protein
MNDKTGFIAAFVVGAVAWTSGSPDASLFRLVRVPSCVATG